MKFLPWNLRPLGAAWNVGPCLKGPEPGLQHWAALSFAHLLLWSCGGYDALAHGLLASWTFQGTNNHLFFGMKSFCETVTLLAFERLGESRGIWEMSLFSSSSLPQQFPAKWSFVPHSGQAFEIWSLIWGGDSVPYHSPSLIHCLSPALELTCSESQVWCKQDLDFSCSVSLLTAMFCGIQFRKWENTIWHNTYSIQKDEKLSGYAFWKTRDSSRLKAFQRGQFWRVCSLVAGFSRVIWSSSWNLDCLLWTHRQGDRWW